jgi:hypothetical protein
MTKTLLSIFVFALFCFTKVSSQVNYSFSASSGTYTPISGTAVTLVSAGVTDATAADEGYANNIPIGFTFNYNGVNYTTVHINTNGFVALGTPFTTPANGYYANNLSTGPVVVTSARPVIAPLWDDLDMDITADNSISYSTSGTAPNRVFTVQYSNARWDYSSTVPVISFQVKFTETTNVIQFIYKQEAGAVVNTSGGASIGITAAGTGSGNFISLSNSSAAPAVSTTVSTNNIATKPATGQIYTFTPATCLAPANLQATNVTSTSATFSWNAVAGAAGYEYAVSTSINPPASGTATTATSVNLTNLTPASVNYLYVRTNCGSSFSVWARKTIIPCTNNITPANNATNVAVPTIVSWNAVAGATAYKTMFSLDGVTFFEYETTTATSLPIPTNYSTIYYFYIRPVAGTDTASVACQSNATKFTTQGPPPLPVNDSCGAATVISASSGIVNGYTVGATPSPNGAICPPVAGDPPSTPDDDVWYSFKALQNGTGTITVTGDAFFDAVVSVYSGSCSSLTLMSCIDTSSNGGTERLTLTNLVAGQTYYIRVYDWDVDNPGTFTISLSGPALPVGITQFTGEQQGSKNVLKWITATEQNNKGFEIQRSVDGTNFSSIGFVISKAVQGSSASTSYSFDDAKPFANNNYYRLKQIDKDGKETYTNIVSLKGQRPSTLQLSRLYPNPASASISLIVTAPANDKISIVVTDFAGRVVMQKTSAISAGDNKLSLNVAQLSAGSYMIKAISENGSETSLSKFMKQ